MVDWNRWWGNRRTTPRERDQLPSWVSDMGADLDQAIGDQDEVVRLIGTEQAEAIGDRTSRQAWVRDHDMGAVVVVTADGERLHLWVNSIQLVGGVVEINGYMLPLDEATDLIDYEVYGSDMEIITKRPLDLTLGAEPSKPGDVQNLMIRWTILDGG